MCTDSITKIPLGEGVCGDGSAELKEPEHHNRLKRPFEDEEEESEKEEEEEEEEEEGKTRSVEFDSPYSDFYVEKIVSDLHSTIVNMSTKRMASKFIQDPKLVSLFNEILQLLNNDVTDAESFFGFVNQVLETPSFINEFYNESSSAPFFINYIRTYGIITQNRVEFFGEEKNEKLLSLIKKDPYFGKALKGDPEFVFKGIVGIIIVFCISEQDLRRMGRKIGKVEPELWVGEATPPELFKVFGLELDDDE